MGKWYRLTIEDMEMEMDEKTKELDQLRTRAIDPTITPQQKSELEAEIKKKAHARRLLGCRIHYRLHGKSVSNLIYKNELKQKEYKNTLKLNTLNPKAQERMKKRLEKLQVACSELKKKEENNQKESIPKI